MSVKEHLILDADKCKIIEILDEDKLSNSVKAVIQC